MAANPWDVVSEDPAVASDPWAVVDEKPDTGAMLQAGARAFNPPPAMPDPELHTHGPRREVASWGDVFAAVPGQIGAYAAQTIAGMKLRELEELAAAGYDSPELMAAIERERGIAMAAQEGMAEQAVPNMDVLQSGVQQGLVSLPIAGPALAAGIVTRNPAVAAGAMYPVTAGQKYGELRAGGLEPELAGKHASFQGAVETGTELLPFAQLLKRVPGGELFLKTLLAEVPGEIVATVMQGGSDFIAEAQRKGLEVTPELVMQAAAKASEGIPETIVATLVGTGVQTGAMAGVNRAAGTYSERRSERQDDEAFASLSDALGQRYAVEALNPANAQWTVVREEPFVPQLADSPTPPADLNPVPQQPVDLTGMIPPRAQELAVPAAPSAAPPESAPRAPTDAQATATAPPEAAQRPESGPVKGKGWQPDPRTKWRYTPDPKKDSVLAWLAKSGGVSIEDVASMGIDPANFGVRGGFRVQGLLPFRKDGMKLDEAAERLSADGYAVVDENGRYDPRLVVEAIFDELAGKPRYSTINTDVFERMERERQAQEAQRAELDAAAPPPAPEPVIEPPPLMTNWATVKAEDMTEEIERLKKRFPDEDLEDDLERILSYPDSTPEGDREVRRQLEELERRLTQRQRKTERPTDAQGRPVPDRPEDQATIPGIEPSPPPQAPGLELAGEDASVDGASGQQTMSFPGNEANRPKPPPPPKNAPPPSFGGGLFAQPSATAPPVSSESQATDEEPRRRTAQGNNSLEKDMEPKARKALQAMFKDETQTRNLNRIREGMELYARLNERGDEGDADASSRILATFNAYFTDRNGNTANDLEEAVWAGLQQLTGEEDPDPAELLENEVFATAAEAGELIFFSVDPQTASFDVEEFNTAQGMVEFRRPVRSTFPKPQKSLNLTAKPNAPTRAVTPGEANKVLEAQKAEAKRIGTEEDHSGEVIVSLFDRTGVWAQPWKDAGYKVITADVTTGQDLMQFGKWMDEVEELISEGYRVAGVLAAPPCTSFSSSGARWWAAEHDAADTDMVEKKYGEWAAENFEQPIDYANTLVAVVKLFVAQADPVMYAMENPVGRIASQNHLPEATLTFNPHNYGDPYTKKTMLWGEFDPNLPINNVNPELGSKIHKLRGDRPEQKAERSATPEGFSYAFFTANHPYIQARLAEQEPQSEGQRKAAEITKPVPAGMVRYYHGGNPEGVTGKLWFTSSLNDAKGWASRSDDMDLWYVDVPEDSPVRGSGDLPNGIPYPSRIELPADIAARRKRFVEEPASQPAEDTEPAAPLADAPLADLPQPPTPAAANEKADDPLAAIAAERVEQIRRSIAARRKKHQELAPKRDTVIGASDFDTMFQQMVKSREGETADQFAKRQIEFVQRMRTAGLAPQLRAAIQMMKHRYGFLGVEMKKGTSPREALDVMLDLFNNLETLSALVGLPHNMMSFGGTIHLRFARRFEHGELAHFEPVPGFDLSTIGLARRADSFAHEWFHALDMMVLASAQGSKTRQLLSQLLTDPAERENRIPDPIFQAFRRLLGTVMLKDAAAVDAFLDMADRVAEKRIEIELAKERVKQIKAQIEGLKKFPFAPKNPQMELDESPANLKMLNPGEPGYEVYRRRRMAALHPDKLGRDQTQAEREEFTALANKQRLSTTPKQMKSPDDTKAQIDELLKEWTTELKRAKAAIEQFEKEHDVLQEAMEGFMQKNASDYFRNQARIDAQAGVNYFATPWEMLARTFESWVGNKIGQIKGTEAISAPAKFYNTDIRYPHGGFAASVYAELEHFIQLVAKADYHKRRMGFKAFDARARQLAGLAERLPDVPDLNLPRGSVSRLDQELYEQGANDPQLGVLSAALGGVQNDVRAAIEGAQNIFSAVVQVRPPTKGDLADSYRWLHDKMMAMPFMTARGGLLALERKYAKNPTLKRKIRRILMQIATDPGSGLHQPQTYEEAVEQYIKKQMNRLGRLIDKYGLDKLDDAGKRQLRDYLTRSVDAQLGAARHRKQFAVNRLQQPGLSDEERQDVEQIRDDADATILLLNGLVREGKKAVSLEAHLGNIRTRMSAVQDEIAAMIDDTGKARDPKDAVRLKAAFNELEELVKQEYMAGEMIARKESIPKLNEVPDELKGAANAIRTLMDELYYYSVEAGLDLGYVANGYLPRILDDDAIETDRQGFLAAARRAYEDKRTQDVRVLQDRITRLHDRRREIKGKLKGKVTAEGRRPPALLEMIDRQLAAAKRQLEEAQKADPARQADAYLLAMSLPDFFNAERATPPRKYQTHRVLPASADQLMADYFITDPLQLVERYINSVARRGEYARRFGAHHELLDEMRTDLLASGFEKADFSIVDDALKIATGSYVDSRGKLFFPIANAAYSAGIIYLLPKALFAQLAEPLVAGMRMGGVSQGLRNLAATFADLARTGTARDFAELSEFIGVTGSAATDQIIHNRFLYSHMDSQWAQRTMSGFFRVTGIHGYTQASRRATLRMAHFYLTNAAKRFRDGTAKEKAAAKEILLEAGVSSKEMDAFTEWLTLHQAPLTRDEMMEIGDAAVKELYAGALNRIIDQTIQNPKAVDRPVLAYNPLGRFVASVMAFAYTFQRNVLIRTYKQIERAKGWDKMGVAAGLLPAIITLMIGQLLAQLLRDLWDDPTGERVAKRLERYAAQPWRTVTDSLSRSGFYGAMDPFYQMATHFKYQKSIAQTMIGAIPGFYAAAIDDIMAGIEGGSEETNTQERKGWRALYRLTVPILAASFAVWAKMFGPLGFALVTQSASHGAAEDFAELMAPKTPKELAREKRQQNQRDR